MASNLGSAPILITGGAGFIGSHTVDLLLESGCQVRVLDNLSSGSRGNLPRSSRLQLIHGDILDRKTVQIATEGVNHVLHLAAQVSVQKSVDNPIQSCQQNILGFLTILDAAHKVGARLVYASSAAVYGEPIELPIKETNPIRPISPYGLEKVTNEQYASLYTRLHGTSQLGLRYFNVYGPRQDPTSPYSGVITKFIHMLLAGRSLTVRGDGLQERDFIHVRDVARANVAALSSDYVGVLNIAGGQAITIRQLTEVMTRILGSAIVLSHTPNIPGDIRRSVAQNGAMIKHLGKPQVTLAEGLAELMQEAIQPQQPQTTG
ncbi:NAD-dependent epimerase/dehydratase family protein [Acidithiobacillus ferrianus]|uniref:NAD-dependent epimerase/dehydratase family protein n=3 Tax=Acidithiobacillus ferrianus TaxID=2678518 RepID=A0A845U5K7_9PROT|nr:NAD-dependent epimerase/dehydratase family protein [Acidithiobacillus ferrianus]NDU41081.1 NAD-dependent epimerase/dehydratase family protein [Acidithiobacillus ferrianus]